MGSRRSHSAAASNATGGTFAAANTGRELCQHRLVHRARRSWMSDWFELLAVLTRVSDNSTVAATAAAVNVSVARGGMLYES